MRSERDVEINDGKKRIFLLNSVPCCDDRDCESDVYKDKL
jgi:hypothetical protein